MLEVARAYPHIDVVGVDISEKMIRYAQAQARVLGLDNVSFQVMDVINPLAFPEEAFDFVNARFISPFMPKDGWPPAPGMRPHHTTRRHHSSHRWRVVIQQRQGNRTIR